MSEEWGFIGASLLIISYAYIVFSGIFLGLKKNNKFHKFVILCSSMLFFFHVFINIGMVSGILPVVGVPLPLMSYGGSSFIMFSICIGIIVSRNNFKSNSY
jgi:rod shape determining protein RodA